MGKSATSTLVFDDLRRRWRLVLVVGVLMGLTAGVGLATIDGARRTQTSFPRHLEASRAADVEIDPGTLDADSDAALRSLPGVEEASWWAVEGVYLLDDEGEVREDTVGLLTITSDGRYLDMDRVAIVEGRRVDPDRPDEIMINEGLARVSGLGLGDHVPLGWVPYDEQSLPRLDVPPVEPIEATVVGIMALNEDVVSEDLETDLPRLYVSPAYEPPTPGYGPTWYSFAWYGLRLTDGRDGADDVITAWNEVAQEHNRTVDFEAGETEWLRVVRRTEDVRTKAELAVRPLVIALATFGAVLVLTVVLLGSQALSRSARQEADRLRVLRQLGTSRSVLLRTGLAVPGATAGLAVVVALTSAWALSSRFPAGPFTELEPNPGRHLDLVVLGPGLALLVAVPVAVAALTLGRVVAGLLRPAATEDQTSRISRWLARSGSPEPVTAAVRLISPGRGASFVPTRSVLASTIVVVVVLVGGVVFADNLDTLGKEPSRFGWTGDSLIMSDGGYGGFDLAGAEEYVATRDDVDGWRLIAGDRTSVDGRPTPGLTYGPSVGAGSEFAPILTEGSAPAAPDEVVLGEETMAQLGLEIGDTVELGNAGDEATIVGTAVFPVFGPLLAVKTDLGVGAWVHPDAHVFDFIRTDFGPPYNGLLLDLAPGAEPESGNGSAFDEFGVVRPIEVQSTTDAGRYEPAIVAALGVTGLLTILLTLVAVVRRRRRDLATYRVLGFTPRQLRATIGVQGLLFGVAALVIGVPLGVVAGRELWRRFADTLGVVEITDVPWALVAATGAAVVAVCVLSAVPPAIAAGRRRLRPRDERG